MVTIRAKSLSTALRALLALVAASGGAASPTAPAEAARSSLFWLSGSWRDLADFVSMGGCASLSPEEDLPDCSAARPAYATRRRVRATALLSATEILLEVADGIDSKDPAKRAPIGKLLEEYDHAELLLDARVGYDHGVVRAGVHPIRLSGQFLLHNPNLPLASAVLRQDSVAYAGTSWHFGDRVASLALGAQVRYLRRKETALEASLVDVASQGRDELVTTQRRDGVFGDAAVNLDFLRVAHVAVEAKDIGRYVAGRDLTRDALFLYDDHRPRVQGSFGATAPFPAGRPYAGITTMRFVDGGPPASDTIFAVAAYSLGPTRLLGSWRPRFFRTGLSVGTESFTVDLAQEWKNELQAPRGSKPRFTVQVEADL